MNNILQQLCRTHGFVFVDNGNITVDHLQRDGIHLTEEGSVILANNYLFYLNDDAHFHGSN